MGGPGGLGYASGTLNQSMGQPLQQTVNSSMDLNNASLITGMNNAIANGIVTRPSGKMNSKNSK